MQNILLDLTNVVEEKFETLLQNKTLKVEIINSPHFPSGDDKWYDQDWDELVFLVKGKAKIELLENKHFSMKKGDYLFIPRGQKHRLANTSKNPTCTWIAIHVKPELDA